ncbi:hypothetical protein GWC77_00015 [Paraburkholderia sp. NMBU_R16]|uniref:hypothetical protein n=1 Tax=Paraburkholderia sp. NMBU_R16 TaxID=2698676 RepID=UPI0015634920|nr:hypothetical protein [Paraburkholderia sp. NMBU_R16]NRO94325.1 hypothetical protein [Paraburkholderia sp. NMBU_R16]
MDLRASSWTSRYYRSRTNRSWTGWPAEAALELACTHFIESDPVQAIFIAQHAPLLRLIWWDAARRAAKLVAIHAWRGADALTP